jgi:hypothetical protein
MVLYTVTTKTWDLTNSATHAPDDHFDIWCWKSSCVSYCAAALHCEYAVLKVISAVLTTCITVYLIILHDSSCSSLPWVEVHVFYLNILVLMLGFCTPYFKKVLEIFSFLADISDAPTKVTFFTYQNFWKCCKLTGSEWWWLSDKIMCLLHSMSIVSYNRKYCMLFLWYLFCINGLWWRLYTTIWTSIRVGQHWKIRNVILHEGLNMHLMIFIQNRVTRCCTEVLLPDCWPVTALFFAGCCHLIIYKSRISP